MSVKLRKKKIAGGKISLYLDIYHNGQRQYEFLKLYLFKGTNTATKVANNETLVLAETITAKRQIEINHSEYGLIPKFKKEADFVEYFKTIGQRKGRSVKIWKNTLNHLKTFTGGKVTFKNINERWLEKYQDYLLKQVSRNSAHTYYSKIKAALNHAVRDKIIQCRISGRKILKSNSSLLKKYKFFPKPYRKPKAVRKLPECFCLVVSLVYHLLIWKRSLMNRLKAKPSNF